MGGSVGGGGGEKKKSPKILRESKVHKKDGESIIRVQRKNLPNIPKWLLQWLEFFIHKIGPQII